MDTRSEDKNAQKKWEELDLVVALEYGRARHESIKSIISRSLISQYQKHFNDLWSEATKDSRLSRTIFRELDYIIQVLTDRHKNDPPKGQIDKAYWCKNMVGYCKHYRRC